MVLVREQARWHPYVGHAENADAAVVIPQEIAWKLFTKWIAKEEALRNAEVQGDVALASTVFEMTSVIA